MMANIEESTRGGRILLYQGFRYMKNLEKNDTIYWRCCVGKCHTPIRTNVFKNSDTIRVFGVGKHNHPVDRSNVYDDNRHGVDDVDDDVLGSYLVSYRKSGTECPNMLLDDQMQCENSKESRAGMFDDSERETNIERKSFTCEQNKERNKVNTEMDDNTKVNIFANEFKKYMKVMNELEEQNFGSLLKRIISKCDLNALLFGEMISNGKFYLCHNLFVPIRLCC